jgi:F0F1-type ATP synthase assembly protein I
VRDYYRGLGGYGTVGLELVLSILFGFFAGRWIDQKTGAGGWVTLLGFGLGLVAGFRSVYRAAVRMRREAEAMDERERQTKADKPTEGGPDGGT